MIRLSTLSDATANAVRRGRQHFPWVAAALLYAAVTLAMVQPFIRLDALATASFPGDGRLIVWTLAWPLHALVTGTPLFDANMYYPTAQALRYSEHMLTLAALAAPINVLTGNPVLACNVVWLLSFWTNAMGMHTLLVWLTRRHVPAIIASLIFAWGFFRMSHLAHLQLQWTVGLPLLLVALGRWYRAPSATRMTLAFVLAAMHVFTSWYLAIITVALGGSWLVWLFAFERRPGVGRRVLQLCAAALVGVVAVTPLALPYLQTIGPASAAEVLGASADLGSYVIPPRNTMAGQLLQRWMPTRWIWGEQTLFLGWTAMLFAGVGLAVSVQALRRATSTRPAYFAALGGFAFWLSRGPSAEHLAPFDLFLATPGLSLFRAPGRFGLLVLLSVAVLAGFGVAELSRRVRAPVLDAVVTVLVGIAVLGESFVVGADIPRAERLEVPTIYRALDQWPPGPVVSLPDYRLRPEWFLRADYLLFAAHHWRPIVNGYGRAEPPEYLSIIEQLSQFPSSNAVDLARALGIRYVVIHTALWTTGPVRTGGHTPGVRLLARDGPDLLFGVDDSSP